MRNPELIERIKQFPTKRTLAVLVAGLAISGCGDEIPGDPEGLPVSAKYLGAEERLEARAPGFGEGEPKTGIRVWRINGYDLKSYDCPEGQEFNYEMFGGRSSYVDGNDATEYVNIWCEWNDRPVIKSRAYFYAEY
jgi:hypothetical protein